jgi:hypothetical protein
MSTVFADDMGGMKRLGLILVALGTVCLGASAGGSAQAYQPVEAERLFADPETSAPGATFDAVLEECFPGERVFFLNLGEFPYQFAQATCDLVNYEARVSFQAPEEVGEYRIVAFLFAEESDNPDIPDRPNRILEAFYFVEDTTVDLVPFPGGGGIDSGAAVTPTGGSGDIWPSFMSSAAFYRTFFTLLAMMVGGFFVWLWRRRREDERLVGTYRPSAMPPPDPGTPSMA